MAILVLMPTRNTEELVSNLRSLNPLLDLRIWPDTGNKNDIDFAIVWNHPEGELLNYPNLKVIASYGAGVDHIFRDKDLPDKITVTRFVDKNLIDEIKEFVLAILLDRCHSLRKYARDQLKTKWNPVDKKKEKKVGIMGLGRLGYETALYLSKLNFEVFGWSKNAKNIPGTTCFDGENKLTEFLSIVDYLVCLLPLTKETESILSIKLFSKMKDGAYLINVARGKLLVEDDLIKALDENKLSGASLDVFHVEPLPENHPFWKHPKILITPHIASLTDPKSIAGQIYENYQRLKNREPLLNTVDISRGY